ncbi:MAG TPA: TonB-dependent receptor, partial [Sphingobium sp.]|nr:TonB-dependent receptor [Sphingobium sp.]
MQTKFQNGVRIGLFLASAMTSSLAIAQTDNGGINEIIVTAQKREQNLQDVPIAVAVIGQQELTASRITSLQDVGAVAPGVSV